MVGSLFRRAAAQPRLSPMSLAGRREVATFTSGRRDYPAAIEALNTLQSNTSLLDLPPEEITKTMQRSKLEIQDWITRIGYKSEDFNAINVLHISGTKGKGSTCAILSSILTEYCHREGEHGESTPSSSKSPVLTPSSPSPPTHPRLQKIGLFISPHLQEVRERIQINGTPLSREKFAQYLFEVWDRFAASEARLGLPQPPQARMPAYFRFLTLMALHTFLREGVDAAILETGIGGEYDCTNVVPRPAVTGVTSLGYDHTQMLGTTLKEIAWQKAGIFKPGVPAFTVPQPEEAMVVLRARAQERETADGGVVKLVDVHPEITAGRVKIGLAGKFQQSNASLAVAMASRFLRDWEVKKHRSAVEDGSGSGSTILSSIPTPTSLPLKFRRGLENVRWPGRCDRRVDVKQPNVVWHIDGAHTVESVELAAEWFRDSSNSLLEENNDSKSQPRRVLIFYQLRRDTVPLLRILSNLGADSQGSGLVSGHNDGGLPYFSHVFFSTNTVFEPVDSDSNSDSGSFVNVPSTLTSESPTTTTPTANLQPSSKTRADTFNAYLTTVASQSEDPLAGQKKLAQQWLQLTSESPSESLHASEKNETGNAGGSPSPDTLGRPRGGQFQTVDVTRTIEDAVERCRRMGAENPDTPVHVFVTGSLYLAGGMLEMISADA